MSIRQRNPDLNLRALRSGRGFTLIEVLVTFLIISIGLLGLAALQTTTVNEQFEAYQRVQITSMLEDMAQRIRANPVGAQSGAYTGSVTDPYGQQEIATCPTAPGAARDLCEWNRLLAGEAAVDGLKAQPLNAAGCLDMVTASGPNGEVTIRVAVAWQGLTPSVAPGDDCAEGDYGDEGLRRVAFRDVTVR